MSTKETKETIIKTVADQNAIVSEALSFAYQNAVNQSTASQDAENQDASDKALREVSLKIKAGECVVLCGKSGCGKTTFSRFLNGLSPSFFEGEMTGDCDVLGIKAGEAPIEAYVSHVGSVFQNPKTQYFNVDTTAELAFPCENVGMEPEKIKSRIAECAESLCLEKLLNRSVFALSGGEKQRLAFGSACMLNPEILVLDEPTSNLDQVAMRQLHDLIAKKKHEGCTIVIAEHRLAWIADLTDRLILFEDGMITREWNHDELMQLDDTVLHKYGLRSLNLKPAVEQLHQKKQILMQEVECEKECKKECKKKYENQEAMQKPLMTKSFFLEAKELAVGYEKKQPVLTIPYFQVSGGEIIGIMGHNGAGKSTFASTLCGLLAPVSGTISINGKETRKKDRIKNSFLVMQDVNYQLFLDSILEEVKMGAAHPQRAEEVLKKLDLWQFADRHPMSLSGGQKQRVAIACAVLSEKNLILFDEPTSGLDYWHMQQVGEQLQWLKEQNRAVLVITHDEEFAAEWCDRILDLDSVLNLGSVNSKIEK